MHLEETPDQLALRAELRAYFAQLLTPEVRHALDYESEGGADVPAVVRQMGTDGWLGHRLADGVRRPGAAARPTSSSSSPRSSGPGRRSPSSRCRRSAR